MRALPHECPGQGSSYPSPGKEARGWGMGGKVRVGLETFLPPLDPFLILERPKSLLTWIPLKFPSLFEKKKNPVLISTSCQ